MKSTPQILMVTLSGFLALFFLDGVERGLFLVNNSLNYINQSGVRLLAQIMIGLVSGLIAGGVIGFALSIKNKVPMMAVCGLGFIAGRLLSVPAFWQILGIPTGSTYSEWNAFLTYFPSSVTGLFVGGLVGLVWKGWKTGLAFGLAGCLIFILAGLASTYSFSFLFYDRGLEQIVSSNVMDEGHRIPIFLVIGRSIFGGFAGLLWGILLDRYQRIGFNRLKSV